MISDGAIKKKSDMISEGGIKKKPTWDINGRRQKIGT